MPGFRNATKATTRQRGYGPAHRAERARWARLVEAGQAFCQQGIPGNGSSGTCLHRTRWIRPGSRWCLGHRDDRQGWIGPVHALCNQRDGATRGGKASHTTHHTRRRAARAHTWQSREW